MKSLYVLLLCSVYSLKIWAQPGPPCAPSEQYADSSFGVWPDTLTNLPCAFAQVPIGYDAVIDIKTFTDTTISFPVFGNNVTVNAKIAAFRILQVQGLPANFIYSPNAPEWVNAGIAPNLTPVQGCVSIAAPQSAVQAALQSNPVGIDYPLNILVDAKILTVSPPIPLIDVNDRWLSELGAVLPGVGAIPVAGYRIRVRPGLSGPCENLPTSMNQISAAEVLQGNFPNPFSRNTDIVVNATKTLHTQLEVFNMVGKKVQSMPITLYPGENKIHFHADGLQSGIYFYAIEIDGKRHTRKMNLSTH